MIIIGVVSSQIDIRISAKSELECTVTHSPHLAIIALDSDCAWLVGDYSNQGYFITQTLDDHNLAGIPGGWIIMQKDFPPQVVVAPSPEPNP